MNFLGVSDDVTTCDCCGRTGLKKTIALDDDNGVVHYGTACAQKALDFAYTKKEIGRLAAKAQAAADDEASIDASYLASKGLKEEWV